MSVYAVLVIGAAVSTLLGRKGYRVLRLEKSRFPRPKLCGEFLASDSGFN